MVSNEADRQIKAEIKRKEYERLLETLGKEHPHTLKAQFSLAVLLNDIEEKVKAQKEIYKTECRVLGEKHPQTMRHLRQVALAVEHYEGCDEAIEFREKFYKLRLSIYGEEDSRTQWALNWLNNLKKRAEKHAIQIAKVSESREESE